MYKENETLVLLSDVGKEGAKGFIPKGTEVTFIKAVDFGFQSFVAVQYKDRMVTLPEIAVAPTQTNPSKELKKFNKLLMEKNPELKEYHPNPILRLYYRLVNFIKSKLTRSKKKSKKEEADLSLIVDIINEGGEVE